MGHHQRRRLVLSRLKQGHNDIATGGSCAILVVNGLRRSLVNHLKPFPLLLQLRQDHPGIDRMIDFQAQSNPITNGERLVSLVGINKEIHLRIRGLGQSGLSVR